jgi:SAM-dependent methyltransferase
MPIELENLDFLASDSGATLLNRLAGEDLSEANTLTLLTQLRRDYSPQQAGAALELARLRQKAVEKFGESAARMFVTREALEQASHPLVRRYRSSHATGNRIIDACCGIGADSLAFAAAGGDVLGLDIDPLRVEMARLNASVFNLQADFQAADVRAGLREADFVFFDPARRDANGKRIFDVERYHPPLSVVREWKHDLIGVKLSPGVDLAQIEGYDGAVEFISVKGDLKEATLWLGGDQPKMRAVLLTDDAVHTWDAEAESVTAPLSEPLGWLVEPDPALIRAGLVADAALAFDGFQLDETIAYFTTEQQPESPWLRSWQALDWLPFNLKKLRAYLRDHQVGHVVVKKRGTAVMPDTLIPRLKLKGSESRTLVLTRHLGKQIVIVCA